MKVWHKYYNRICSEGIKLYYDEIEYKDDEIILSCGGYITAVLKKSDNILVEMNEK